MADKIERDAVTNVETTGHEWDGIKELNNPLPRWWLWVLYATIVFSIGYYVLYPAWPGISGHTKGVLGFSQRERIEQQMAAVRAGQGAYLDQIQRLPVEQIAAKPELLEFSLAGGKAAFADNCAPCHGAGGSGRPAYPVLADDDWLWGGTLGDIQKTVESGIRSTDASRQSQMPRFGADGLLKPEEIRNVAEYVLSLSGRADDKAAAGRGEKMYGEQCAACHMPGGAGNQELGAPRLSDAIWLYGGTREAIIRQIGNPRQGVMPTWAGRLDEATIKMLTVYVHALGGGK